jgi:hypothetical protein
MVISMIVMISVNPSFLRGMNLFFMDFRVRRDLIFKVLPSFWNIVSRYSDPESPRPWREEPRLEEGPIEKMHDSWN